MKLRVLSYNIHKGLRPGIQGKHILKPIRDVIREVHPDLVFLQEVLGKHEGHSKRFKDWPTRSQTEFLAEGLWSHHSYGKNAVHSLGHHGNAILSKFPIRFSENIDISKGRFESRGLLHVIVEYGHSKKPLHAICTHLGLFEADRKKQVRDLIRRIEERVPADEPLVLAGDFNDWRKRSSRALAQHARLSEAFLELHGEHPKTFPVWLPMLRLDRVYFRAMQAVAAQCLSSSPWQALSDHAALVAEFSLT